MVIETLQSYIKSAINGCTLVTVDDLQDILDFIVELKEENNHIRTTHYHESVVKNLMKEMNSKHDLHE